MKKIEPRWRSPQIIHTHTAYVSIRDFFFIVVCHLNLFSMPRVQKTIIWLHKIARLVHSKWWMLLQCLCLQLANGGSLNGRFRFCICFLSLHIPDVSLAIVCCMGHCNLFATHSPIVLLRVCRLFSIHFLLTCMCDSKCSVSHENQLVVFLRLRSPPPIHYIPIILMRMKTETKPKTRF